MKLTFLFLDETITSLDALTTADVADVLHHFVQDNDMKFYVVTHAPQIQEIPIRDAELQIP
jgi:ABC-type lipoprotein export system ATPase subunit